MEHHNVIIIGAGPAGLATAIRLRDLGMKDVVVLEREAQAGGTPCHCGHFGFGWESHRRLSTGPKFAQQLVAAAKGIDIRNASTVLEFTMPEILRVHSAEGISDMSANRVLLATGTRESSRAARLIGGNRLSGVMNAGTLQRLVYLKSEKPFSKPVIIGNEWVTFSALMTCKHAAIKPVGIYSEDEKIDAPWFFPLGAKLRYGVPTQTRTKLIAIHGHTQVEAVEIERDQKRSTIICDGVILTGKFLPENSLNAPESVARIGNVNGAVNTAGRCVVEARAMAETIAKQCA
jgi:thioredoxin reductase